MEGENNYGYQRFLIKKSFLKCETKKRKVQFVCLINPSTPRTITTRTHGKDLRCILESDQLVPVQHRFFHHSVERDWRRFLIVFVSLLHKLHCIQTTQSILCSYRQLLSKIEANISERTVLKTYPTGHMFGRRV